MVDSGSQDGTNRTGSVSRRRFVKAAGASGVALGVAGCVQQQGNGGGGNGGGNGGQAEKIKLEEPKNKVKIKWAADSRAKENAQVYKQALRKGGLSDKVEIEILAGSQVTDNRQSQYQQWLSAGRAEPAVLMMDSGWTIPFIARNQIQNLTQSLPKSMVSTIRNKYFNASVKTAVGNNGDLFGVPLFPDFPTMQYRKDLVKEAGYDPSGWATKPMSWKRFSEITADVQKQTGKQYGFTFQAQAYEGLSCCDFNEFMSSWGGAYFGGNLFGPVGDRPITVDQKPVVDSVKMVRSFINGPNSPNAMSGYKQISPQAVLQWTEEPSRKPFTNGSAIMHRNWPYSIAINGAKDVFGKDLGVMPLPYGVKESEAKIKGRGGSVCALGGWHLCMNPNAPQEKKQAAALMMKATMSPEYQLMILEKVGTLPPRKELFNSDRANNVPVMGRYMDTLGYAGERAVPRPVTVVWPQESTKIAQQVNNAFAGKQAPKQAMNQLKKDLKAIEQNA